VLLAPLLNMTTSFLTATLTLSEPGPVFTLFVTTEPSDVMICLLWASPRKPAYRPEMRADTEPTRRPTSCLRAAACEFWNGNLLAPRNRRIVRWSGFGVF